MCRVALIGENSTGYINALLDIWNSGDSAVLIDWRIPIQTSVEMMLEAEVHKCFIEKKLFNSICEKIIDDIEIITYDKQNNISELLPTYVYEKFQENYSDNEAVVIYSSGTTGKSKGIILSHFAINTNADSIIDYMNPTIDDCIYIVKTISHASSLVGELLVALKCKIPLVIAPIIVPPRYIMTNICKFKVTIMCINPTLLQMYMEEYDREKDKYDLSSLKQLYVHGAKTSLSSCQLASKIFEMCSIYYEYGLTEAGPRVTTQKLSCKSIDSVGRSIKDVQVKIIDQEGNEAINNQIGVVHIKTKSVYRGYISGYIKFKSLYKDWLNTGDIGYIDEFDELHIVGRADDVIIINAHKIYPSEVEKKIIECTTVRDCVVTKVSMNGNEVLGCLYIGDSEIERTVKNSLKTKLMIYEIPKFFVRCNELPKTLNGKIAISEVKSYLNRYFNID